MLRTQRYRAKLFAPLLRLMAAGKITPDHITLLSLLWAFTAVMALKVLTGFIGIRRNI